MERIITYDSLRNFAYSNDKIVKGSIRGVVLFFMGAGNVSVFREDTPDGQFYAQRGILYVVPYTNPWAWANRRAVDYADEILDVLFEHYHLPEGLPVVSTGESMGGQLSLVYPVYARRTPVACVANCPVCDGAHHFAEHPELLRQYYSALSGFDGSMEEGLKSISPLHLAEKMPKIAYHVFQCDQDVLVPIDKHADRFVAAMRALGHKVTYDVVRGQPHCALTDGERALFREYCLLAVQGAPGGIPRPEHPRPDFMRGTFLNLNGYWQFAFDDADAGLRERWQTPGRDLGGEIVVPFGYQTRASGLGPTDEIHPVLWYRRSFIVPGEMRGRRVLLRFGAVDYSARVYVNGELAGEHTGGYAPFALDVTPLLCDGENDLCVRVRDDPDRIQPRGKQLWKRGLQTCVYTPVSGIWQTVYLEAAGDAAVEHIHATPDVDAGAVQVETALETYPGEPLELELTASFAGKTVRVAREPLTERAVKVTLPLGEDGETVRLWSPGEPNLYGLRARVLRGDEELDAVDTYFGMRKVELKDNRVCVNGEPVYLRMVLDQGYWPDTLITPPSDEAIRQDLQYTLDFGYNGARKHQKIEDPRYYYWADRMGLLVWGEMPSPFIYTDDTVRNMAETMLAFIERDFNHPSIICWTPINESWGVPDICRDQRQQQTARMLYHLTKAADGTRLCSSNDGWEQVITDICALHDYAVGGERLAEHFPSREAVEAAGCIRRRCYALGVVPTGREAFMVTEYGGIAIEGFDPQCELGDMHPWYLDLARDGEMFLDHIGSLTRAIQDMPFCVGYCYTQLTDVMQENNGLLTPDRKPKIDPARLREINERRPASFDESHPKQGGSL